MTIKLAAAHSHSITKKQARENHMTEIIFIEGVSGVGKTTLVKALQAQLQSYGYTVKSYIEFDFINPIDFYCTAYIPNIRYQDLCQNHLEEIAQIKRHSISAGTATLVRYFDGDMPLFSERLIDELREMEFCYKPSHPVPLADYSKAYRAVWENFGKSVDNSVDCYIFDGSLLHHPLNDMIRNYDASKEQTAAHVKMLLNCLKNVRTSVFYLFTEDLAGQLRLARQNRRQAPPDNAATSFWKKRREYDDHVLKHSVPAHQMMNVTKCGYKTVLDKIVTTICDQVRDCCMKSPFVGE